MQAAAEIKESGSISSPGGLWWEGEEEEEAFGFSTPELSLKVFSRSLFRRKKGLLLPFFNKMSPI